MGKIGPVASTNALINVIVKEFTLNSKYLAKTLILYQVKNPKGIFKHYPFR